MSFLLLLMNEHFAPNGACWCFGTGVYKHCVPNGTVCAVLYLAQETSWTLVREYTEIIHEQAAI